MDAESSHDGALGVILLRPRIAEDGHQPIAQPLDYLAAEPGDRLRGLVQIGANKLRQSSTSSEAASSVEPTRSQNMIVIGRRSAELRCAKDRAGAETGASVRL